LIVEEASTRKTGSESEQHGAQKDLESLVHIRGEEVLPGTITNEGVQGGLGEKQRGTVVTPAGPFQPRVRGCVLDGVATSLHGPGHVDQGETMHVDLGGGRQYSITPSVSGKVSRVRNTKKGRGMSHQMRRERRWHPL
jgi:hypothetical protein